MATKEASSKKPAAASSGKATGKPAINLTPKAAAAAVRIADNKKALFNYHIEERFEAGMVLEGWEVKALREGKVQLTDGYVVVRKGELFLIGCLINPLRTASTHVNPEAARTRKLLMHKDQIRRLIGKVEQKGYTLVPINLHWAGG